MRHFRSQTGSSLAVSTSVDVLLEFFSSPPFSGKQAFDSHHLHELEKALVENWLAAVSSHLENHPLAEEELQRLETLGGVQSRVAVENEPVLAYGATLLIAAATDRLMLLLQLGDGEILCVSDDAQTTRPMPDDPRLTGNETTSLCQPEAWREFRSAWFAAPDWPALVLLATDGYPNSFSSDAEFVRIGPHYLATIRERGIESLSDELPRILSEASRQGTGDDITLAIVQGDLEPGFALPGAGAVVSPLAQAPDHAKPEESLPERPKEPSTPLEEVRKSQRRLRLIIFLLVVFVVVASIYLLRGRFHLPS